MEQFIALPLPLLKLILVFADDARHDLLLPQAPQAPHALLDQLKRSCKAWKPVVEQLRSELSISATLTLLAPHDATESTEKFAAFATRDVRLRCLALSIVGAEEVVRPLTAQAYEDTNRLWCEAFASVPELERLELHSVNFASMILSSVITAASRACKKIKALSIYPVPSRGSDGDDAVISSTRAAVYEAIERWHEASPRHGLQQLDFVQRYTTSETRDPVVLERLEAEFYTNLARFCPRLEFLNILCAPLGATISRIPLPSWERFATSCMKLRVLDWFCLPYSDRHFEIFARTPKPDLETIVFRNAEGEHTADTTGQCLYSAARVARALAACPNLKNLRIEFAHVLSIPSGFHRQALWDDELLSAIGQHCTHLQTFCLREHGVQQANIPTPLDTVTDVGVSALATLPELRVIKMKATSVTGQGVFELLRHAPTDWLPRKITLDVGCLLVEGFSMDDEDEEVVIFYDVVHQVLELVVAHGQNLRGRRFVLKLKNRSRRDPDTDEWREKLHELIQAAIITVKVELLEDMGRLERLLIRSVAKERK